MRLRQGGVGLHPEGGDKLWRGPELEGGDWTPSPWLGARGRHGKTVRRGVRLSSGRSGKPVQPGAAPSSVCVLGGCPGSLLRGDGLEEGRRESL